MSATGITVQEIVERTYGDDEFILTNVGDVGTGEPLWWAGLGGEDNLVPLGELGPGYADFNGYGDTAQAALEDLWRKLQGSAR